MVDPTFEMLFVSSGFYNVNKITMVERGSTSWARVLTGFRPSLPHDFFVIAKLYLVFVRKDENCLILFLSEVPDFVCNCQSSSVRFFDPTLQQT
jgi:hypothetical protein